jgi:hypothetical protein
MDLESPRKSFAYAVSERGTILSLETLATCGRDKLTENAVVFIMKKISEASLFYFGFGDYVTFGEKESGSKDFKEGCNAILGKKDETGDTRDLQRDPPNRPWITCWLIDV